MNATTKTTLDLAKTLAKSGFHIPALEVHTPDGRTWNIATVPAGRGRHLDGHWGPRPGALGGFRLFEIDRIISRTLSWAVVSGILVAAFGAVVVARRRRR